MLNQQSLFKRASLICILVLFVFSGLMASDKFIRISEDVYENAPLLVRNKLEMIAEEGGVLLMRCEETTMNLLNGEGITFEQIQSYDIGNEDLPPRPNGGIPIGVVVDRGSQGVGGWHQGVAMAGSVLAYKETKANDQLPGFTFWDMEKDSVWHHYIDTDLDADEALFMAASDNKICYAFHYINPAISNSDMRYYWYDVSTGEHGEAENFGYGFEGFGVSDTWMMRVGNKGNGWNNQIYAHNMETGARFELLVDSTYVDSWWYYDNFGDPKVDGNTVVFTYVDFQTYTPDLKVFSLGADGLHGTADDVSGTLNASDTRYGNYTVDGRYIVWVERTSTDDGNIRAFDMGPDELFGTADDVGAFDVCTDPSTQSTVRIDNNIIVWEDKRNSSGGSDHDIYGYDLETSTEFRLTPSPDVFLMADFSQGEVVILKKDWDDSNNNDIYFINIYGRIQFDYYRIDILSLGNPRAISYLTEDVNSAPYSFTNIIRAAKGPLGAVFIKDLPSGNDVIMSYSAVTGDWTSELLSYPAKDYTCMMQNDNGLVIGITNIGYQAWTFNGATGSFSSKNSNLPRPTGFAVGNNISFVWGDDSTYHWIRTYDAERDLWSAQSAYSNDPWHVIATDFSDSLGLLLYGQGDTVCTSVGLKVYDLELHDWVPLDYAISYLRELNRHSYKDDLTIKVNNHFAVAAQEYDYYYDYIYTYSTGDDVWKVKTTPHASDLDDPLLGENFIVQGCRYGDTWQGYIFNDLTGEWLPDYIDARLGIDNLLIFKDLMVAWKENQPWHATVWAYSSQADGIQTLSLQYPGDYFTVKAGAKAVYVFEKGDNYTVNDLHVFNGLKGVWNDKLEVQSSNRFELQASGHTGIFLQWAGQLNGTDKWKAYGYSALRDMWDIFKFNSNDISGIFTSDFCGLIPYCDWYNTSKRYMKAFNGIDGKWSKDVISMYYTKLAGIRLDDRIMLVLEDGSNLDNYAKSHMFSPILNRWSSTSFTNSYEFEGYYTTPTSAFAWDGHNFKIIFSTQTDWEPTPGRLDEIHVTDYAIAATMYYASQTTTHYFYPPRTEIIDEFEFTEGPDINVESSWAVEVTWKTNKYSDTRLVWGVDGYYEIIEKDTLEPTKDHRVLIEGLEAQQTYYYSVISVIEGIDTVHSDTLMFNTGTDNTSPTLVGAPESYRIHDHEASVWWETNEPSTAILQWGLTSAYTDTLTFDETASTINAFRMYGLSKDTTYHYQVGGYDRYGNGPYYSSDYTFRTENNLKIPQNLMALDSTIWGCSYMSWDPPRLDSIFTRESFNSGIPVDWKIYNRGDDPKGNSWQSGYIGNNSVAYCNYGKAGEVQEEWLITNPVKMTTYSGGVLNFWHYGLYNDYDNAPNRVMMSMTGTAPGDFTTIWSSSDLPDDWELVQIDIDWYNNYGETVYFAFIYASTNGETWVIDDIYMDFDVDGFYEDFVNDANFSTYWTKQPPGSRFGFNFPSGNSCIGVNSYETAPDAIQEEDSWMFSPFIKITESHRLLGFWQMGWWSAMDNAPNEIRVAGSNSTIESASTVIRSIYPVPEGWQWVIIDLSSYINQTIKIAFRYHSYAGWVWNGLDWSDWYGETWYIDDMYLFENAPAMVADPNAKPNEKPMKFASPPKGRPIAKDDFTVINSAEPKKEMIAFEAPTGSLKLPKEKPEFAYGFDKIISEPAPSLLAQSLPNLLGYEVYGRFSNDMYFNYLGYVKSPSFVDWDTYLGYEREYYVEAVYDDGNSQPSEKVSIKGGTSLLSNEHAYDTGVLFYSYYWRPGNSFANNFWFQDSVLKAEKMKVHIAEPGTYKMRLSTYAADGSVVPQFTSSTISAPGEGWYLVDVPSSVEAANEFLVEFMPQDTLIRMSYDTYYTSNASWFHYSDGSWEEADYTFYIRLIGDITGPVAIANVALPQEFELEQNYPNPFNPTTTIPFQVPEACDASVKVYDIRGALVKTLMSSHLEIGYYNLVWDGTNSNGNQVASGVYLIKMTAGEYSDTKKMVLVR